MKSQLFFEVGIKDVQKSLDEQKQKIKDWANNNPIELKIELQSLKSQLQALGVAFGSNNKQIQGLSKEVDKAMNEVEKKVKSTTETVSKTLAANNLDKLHMRIAEVDKAIQAMTNHNLSREGGDVFQVLFSRRIKTLEEYKEALKKASEDPNLGKRGHLQGLQFNGEQLLGSVNKMLVSPGTISSVRREMDNILKFRRELAQMEERYKASKTPITITNFDTKSASSTGDVIKANAERLRANVDFLMSTLRDLQAVRAKIRASGGDDASLAHTINEVKNYVAEMQRLGNSTKALGNIKFMDNVNQGLVGRADTLNQLIQKYRELYGLASGGEKGKTSAPVIDTKSINEAVYQVSQLENKLSRIKALEAKASDLGIDTTKMRTLISEMEAYLKKFREVVDNGGKSNGGLTAQMLKSEGEFRSFTARIAENSRELRQNITEKERAASAEGGLQSAIHSSTSALRGQSQVLSDLRSMAQQYVSVWAAKSFVDNIIEQGGQLEQQRLSIQAILGDAAQAQTLFNQVKALAIKSPFGVTEIDQMTKQLSAYGFQYSELFDLTKRLADISAATGTEVSRLALALGHVRSEAALSGYTLRQFSMANVPLLTKLTEKLGVSAKEVRDMVRKKEIGYDQVLEILKELTDESGMFYNAQETMSEALNAKFKNLRDSFQIMYSEMAEGGPGDALKSLAVVLTDLSRNWKILMPMLLTGAGALGLQKLATLALNKGLAITVAETNAAAVATGKYSAAEMTAIKTTGRLNLALRGLQATMMSIGKFVFSPITLGFAAVEGLIYLWQRHNQELEKAKELSDGFKQEGTEGIRNLTERINVIEPSKGKTDSELRQGIDSMTKTLKDYGVNVKQIFDDTFGADASGKVKSLAEQYDYLKGKLEDTLDVYKELQKTADAFEYGIKKTNNGWFDDDVNTDLTQYAEAVKEFQDLLTDFYGKYEKEIGDAVEKAVKSDKAFAEATKNMKTNAEKFREYIRNSGSYPSASEVMNDVLPGTYSTDRTNFNESFMKMFKAKNEAMKELDDFMNAVEDKLKEKGYDFNKLTEAQINNLLKQSREWIDKHPEWANIMDDIKSKLEVRWPIKLEPENTNVGKDLEDWQRQMQTWLEAHGKPLEITADMRREDIVKMVHDKLKEAQTVIDQSSPLLLRFGVDLQNVPDSGNLPAGLQTPWGKKSAKDYKTESAKYQSLMDFLKEFALPGPKDKNKGKGHSEDKDLKKARTRLEETKSFLSEYKKYRETYGKERAINILEDLFPTTKGRGEKIVDNFKNILSEIKGSIKLTTDDRKKFGISIDKLIADTNLSEAKDKLDRQLKQMESYISDNADKFDLYKAIFEKTGNKGFAMSAFLDGQVWDDATLGMADTLREKMGEKGSLIDWEADKLAAEDWFKKNFENGEELYKLWEKIVSLISGNYKTALQKSADVLKGSMTYAERIEAIRADYAEKNKTATTDREKYVNSKAENEEIAQVRLDELKDEINWDSVFGNLQSYTRKALADTRKALSDYIKLNKNSLSVEQLKSVQTAIANLDEVIADKSGLFGGLADSINAYKKATEELTEAEKEYQKTVKKYGENSIQAQDAKKKVSQAQNNANNAQANVKANETNTLGKIAKITNALVNIGKSSESSLADVGNVVGTVVTALSKTGEGIGALIAAIFALLDAIGEQGLDRFLGNILSSVGRAVGGILKGVGNMVGSLFGNSHLGNSIFGDLFATGYEKYEEAKAEYESLISVWDSLIDKKKTYLNQAWGAEANNAGKEALSLLNAEIEATKIVAQQRLSSGASLGSHSIRYRMWEGSYGYNGTNWQDVAGEISRALGGVQFNEMSDMLNMTAEQLLWIKEHYVGLWAHMDDDFKGYLEKLISYSDQADEIVKKANEKLSGWNLDTVKSEWSDLMTDMDKSSDDLAENLEEKLRNAILNSMVSNLFTKRLQALIDSAGMNDKYVDTNGNVQTHTYDSEGNVTDNNILSEYTQGEWAMLMENAKSIGGDVEKMRDMLKEYYGWEAGGNSTSAKIIQGGFTEDETGLALSYMNAMRADLSINRQMIGDYFPQFLQAMTYGNQSLWNIENHTSAIMRNTDSMRDSNAEVVSLIKGLRNKTWSMPVS